MSAGYALGTVALATVRGVPNVRVFRADGSGSFNQHLWVTPVPVDGWNTHEPEQVTDVRPLPVLDPMALRRPQRGGDTDYDAASLARTLRLVANADGRSYRAEIIHEVADQIDEQTKPAPIEVFEHLVVKSRDSGPVVKSVCGKVWEPGAREVTAVGRCPVCAEHADSGWVS